MQEECRKLREKKGRRNRVKTGAVIGLVAGIWGGLFAILEWGVIGVFVWAVLIAVGALIGSLIDHSYDRKIAALEANQMAQSEICQRQMRETRENTEQNIAAYQAAFDRTAQESSLKYVESPLIGTIAGWLLEQCGTMIDHVDRGSHLKTVQQTLGFIVYGDRVITGEYHEQEANHAKIVSYLFEENRCGKLTTPLQITGIARALAQQLQLNLMTRYPEDISGSPTAILIERNRRAKITQAKN